VSLKHSNNKITQEYYYESRNFSNCSTNMSSEEELSISKLYGFKIVQDGRILHDEITGELLN